MTDEKDPLPSSVSEYTIDHPSATPAEVLEAVGLDESCREQVEYYVKDRRYFTFGSDKRCEIPTAVRPPAVEWADVAEWDVPELEASSDG